MAWTHGLILGLGGLLIAIPVLLHFLMQPKPKPIVFPAMRFLKEKQLSNRSSLRLRHLLLLIMRCLLIALVVLALAGPSVASREFGNWLTLGGIGFSGLVVGMVLLAAFFKSNKNWLLVGVLAVLFLGHLFYGGWSAMKLLANDSGEILGDSQAPIAALIVIDTSPRMQYRNENQTRLESGKEMAQWLIQQFPSDSQVCVLASDYDRPFFSVDVSAASRRLEKLETSYLNNPLPSALSEGLQILEKAPQERKEVYVVTDLTRQSWLGENVKPVFRQLEKNPGLSLFVIDVGVADPINFALSSLRLSDAEITQNGGFQLTTQINRIGTAAQRTVKMKIEKPDLTRPVVRDGTALFPDQVLEEQSATLDLRENGSAEVPFQFSKPLPIGTYHGLVEIEGDDSLAIDNQRYFTVRVSSSWKILVVHPEDVSPRNLLSTIAPAINRELGSSSYDCTVVNQSDWTDIENWSDYDGVFLLDPRPLTDPQWGTLSNYVENGGGLAICLGPNAANGPLADPAFATPAAQRILTGSLDRQWLNEDRSLFLSPRDLAHPLFKSFRGLETSMLWNRFPVFLHWGIELGVEGDVDDEQQLADGDEAEEGKNFPTQTLLSFSNREPALIERRIGAGRVLVMTTPITERASERGRRRWNDLFVGKFLPAWMLVRAMTAYLVQDDAESLNIEVGQVASFENDLQVYPDEYRVYSPEPDKLPTSISTIQGRVRYRFANFPGQYRLKGTFDETPVLRGFSVNLSESATDLSRIEPAELDGILGPQRYQLATQKNEIQRQQGTTRRGQEFYPLLLLMMMVVMAVEFLMSNRFYK